MKRFFTIAFERGTVSTSARVALVVGTVLGLINYSDRIFMHGDMRPMDWVKILVTYSVPYCVATYGAVRYAMREEKGHRGDESLD